jgi:hypothetical protein
LSPFPYKSFNSTHNDRKSRIQRYTAHYGFHASFGKINCTIAWDLQDLKVRKIRKEKYPDGYNFVFKIVPTLLSIRGWL